MPRPAILNYPHNTKILVPAPFRRGALQPTCPLCESVRAKAVADATAAATKRNQKKSGGK